VLVSCHFICETCFSAIQQLPTITSYHYWVSLCLLLMDKFVNIPNGNHKVLCLFKEKVLHGTVVAYPPKNENNDILKKVFAR